MQEKEKKEKKKQEVTETAAITLKRSDKKRRLSFKEKQEMQQLENDIELLNNEKVAIENALSSGTLSAEELLNKSRRIAEIINTLDEKEMRWLELSEIDS